MKRKIGSILLILFAVLAAIGFILTPPLAQDNAYHHFSDRDTLMGIANFWNVVSNLPFLLVGIYGIIEFKKKNILDMAHLLFFVGVALVALGSGYYHYEPNSETLVWDRLPMTVAFTALIAIVVSEFINLKAGKRMLVPVIIIGLLSIAYWIQFNDLRFYAVVQFYPILAIPVILLCFKPENVSTKGYWLLIACYLLAKVLETFDTEVHDLLTVMSGHPLKHVAAACGIYFYVKNKS